MSTLFLEKQINPFDVLFRNLFDANTSFFPAQDAKIPHPVDIYDNQEGLHFEVACTGLTKQDVSIELEGDLLRITYTKPAKEEFNDNHEPNFIHKGIAKRSFKLAYKIASKFSLNQATANMENGLLKISIPFAEELKPKSLKIK